MAGLECANCRYKFKRPDVPERCPYCGTQGSVRTIKTAQEFLDEN